jgi:hypothetical protein
LEIIMFMSHAIFPAVWMISPLQILQVQLQRSWIARPLRRGQRQWQFVAI